MTREEFASRLQICRKRLYIAALSVTKNREDAEDALSNATLRALKRCGDFTDTGKFDAWMLTTTMNEAKRLRSSKRYFENADELYDVLDEDGAAEGNVVFFDMLTSAGLGVRCRKVFIMKFLYGYTFDEIASLLRIPASTVRSEYYRGLEKLKKAEGLI